MAQSPIHAKKQGNKKSSDGGGWGGWTKFEKGGRQYRVRSF